MGRNALEFQFDQAQAQWTADKTVLEQQIADLEIQLTGINRREADSSRSAREWETLATQLSQGEAEHKTALQRQDSEIGHLKTELMATIRDREAATLKLQEAEREISKLAREQAEIDQKLSAALSALAQWTQAETEWKRATQNKDQEIAHLKVELVQSGERLASSGVAAQEREALQSQLERVQSDWKQSKQTWEEEISKLKSRCEALQSALRQQQETAQTRIQELEQRSNSSQELQSRLEARTREAQELTDRLQTVAGGTVNLRDLEGQLKQLRFQFEEKNRALTDSRAELWQTESELLRLKREHEESNCNPTPTEQRLVQDLSRMQQEYEGALREMSSLEELVERLLQELMKRCVPVGPFNLKPKN